MIRKIRSGVALVIALALLLSCAPIVLAANTSLTYREYLAMSTEEQIAFRETFDSSADFKKWYTAAKKAYEDSQNNIIIGGDNTVDLEEILNPSVASGTCGENLTWRLSQKGTLSITGDGAMDNYDAASAPWYEYKDQILAVELPVGITAVGENAFDGCSAITDVYFIGTEHQWSGVTVNSGNSNLTEATMHFHEAILDQIAIGQAPAKTTYDIGDSLDTAGLVVTLIYNDGSTSDLLSGFQVSELDASSVGTKTITVSYMNKTTTFDVSVIATPSDIAINTFPTKQNYWVGDTLDTAGLSLTVTYTDGSTDVVTSGFDVSGYTAATPGTKKITVTYQGLTTTFDVVVNEITATGISIATPPQKTTYWVGDTLDTTGLTVKVDYSNGSSDYIETGFTLSSSDLNAAGTQAVTVTYQGFTDTFYVVVNEVTVTGFSIATTPDKLDYWIGEKLDTTGLTLNVNYSNGSSDSVDTGFEVSGFESETEGTKTVTVTYHGFTDTFDVNIITGGVCGENLIWTIVDGVLTIAGSGAMYDYTYGSAPWYGKELTALVVDPSVTYIGKYAFANVACLTQYHIANGVLVGEGAFAKCKNLTAITVDADHSAYTADQSGALYNKDMTTLIMVPAGYSGTFVVPLTVTAIGESAFFGCAKLTAIKFQGKAGATGGFT